MRSHIALRERASAFESHLADASIKLEAARSRLVRRQRRLKETRHQIGAADAQIEALERLRRELERDLAEDQDEGSGISAARAIGGDRSRWGHSHDSVASEDDEFDTESDITRDDDTRGGVMVMNPHTGGLVRVSARGVSDHLLRSDARTGALLSLASDELERSGYAVNGATTQGSATTAHGRVRTALGQSSAPSSHAGSRMSTPGATAAHFDRQDERHAAGRTTDPSGAVDAASRLGHASASAPPPGRHSAEEEQEEDGMEQGEEQAGQAGGRMRQSAELSRVSAVSSVSGGTAAAGASTVVIPTGRAGGGGREGRGIAAPRGPPPSHSQDTALAAPPTPSERVGGRSKDVPLHADLVEELEEGEFESEHAVEEEEEDMVAGGFEAGRM